MTRATNGPATRQRRNRLLKRAKGYRQGRRNLFKMASNTVLRAEAFAFGGRQQKKRLFRSLWITRLTAAVKPHGLRYSSFIHGVQKASQQTGEASSHVKDASSELARNAESLRQEVESFLGEVRAA